MFISGNTSLVKDLNKKSILNIVRINRGITAREISRATGLQMSTTLYTLKELMQAGLITESGLGPSTSKGGKPPQTWELAAGFGYIIGIELLSSEIRLAVINFNKEILYTERRHACFAGSPETAVQNIRDFITDVLKKNRLKKKDILGLGAGIPGSVDHASGVILYSSLFEKRSIAFRDMLQKQTGIFTRIDNDANAGALGVKWYMEEEQESENIIYISINLDYSGMGAGLILNHEIYRGSSGAAGEIADLMSPGQWKILAEKIFGNKVRAGQIPKVSEVAAAARHGDKKSEKLLLLLAVKIARKLIPVVDLLNPGLIVIGGDICEAKEFLEPGLSRMIREGLVSDASAGVEIKFTPFSTYAIAAGSTVLVSQRIFAGAEQPV